jgi:PKD repeat protein
LIIASTATTLNLPPNADANGPYQATEGTPIEFDASGSNDPDGDSLTYRWRGPLGTWDTGWSSSPTASHTYNDDWTGTARVEVSDGTFTRGSTATVTVTNAPPNANAGPDQLATVGEEVQFSGSFTDPGVLDTHTVEWDFGDGTNATDNLTPTHLYSEARKYTVTLTVTDDDDGVGVDTLTVNTGVDVSIAPLAALVPPGDSTTYNVLIHHLGNTEDTYDLELVGLDPTWYSLSSTSVTLSPDQSESVTLTVSPPYATPFKTYGFTVVATSQTDPAVFDNADADAVVYTTLATVESCDSTGAKKDTFYPAEDVYASGTGYSPSTTYVIYVVEDVTAWTDGIAIPSRVPGTATSISSDADGNIPATIVWSAPLVLGKYDIVVDVNGNGVYDEDTDALDDTNIEVTAGFNVIPEVPLGTILASASMMIALATYIAVPKWRRKREHIKL